MIRVAVVDDQELVRAGFRALLDSDPDIEVVAEAAEGRAAVELTGRHRLDVVLMDIRMPGMNGIEATVAIRAIEDPSEVLILTTFDTDENAFDPLEAGAAGFLVKDTPPVQLLAAVKAAAAGGAVNSPATTRRLVDHLVAARIDRSRPTPAAGFATGTLAFAGLGVFLGSIMPTARAAQGLGLLVFFGLFFIAGGGPPPSLLPDVVNDLVDYTPMGPLVAAIADLWHGDGWNQGPSSCCHPPSGPALDGHDSRAPMPRVGLRLRRRLRGDVT